MNWRALILTLLLPYSFLVWEANASAVAYRVYTTPSFPASWSLRAKVSNANYRMSDADRSQDQLFFTVSMVDADGIEYPTMVSFASSFSKLLSPRLKP
jgi:hypothetical protein